MIMCTWFSFNSNVENQFADAWKTLFLVWADPDTRASIFSRNMHSHPPESQNVINNDSRKNVKQFMIWETYNHKLLFKNTVETSLYNHFGVESNSNHLITIACFTCKKWFWASEIFHFLQKLNDNIISLHINWLSCIVVSTYYSIGWILFILNDSKKQHIQRTSKWQNEKVFFYLKHFTIRVLTTTTYFLVYNYYAKTVI